jgi:hypothetical protein
MLCSQWYPQAGQSQRVSEVFQGCSQLQDYCFFANAQAGRIEELQARFSFQPGIDKTLAFDSTPYYCGGANGTGTGGVGASGAGGSGGAWLVVVRP